VDFLLALIELFSLRVTAEELRAIIGWKSAISLQRGSVDPNFQVEGVAPTNHSSSQKTRLNIPSYGVKIWTDLSTVLSQCTRVTDRRTDGRTDRQTEFSSLYRVCITCSAVKTNSGVASYGSLGHVPPSTFNNFILVHFEVNLITNSYPSIV